MNPFIRRQTVSVLSRFRSQEIPYIIDNVFKISWDTIKSTAFSQRINITKSKDLNALCLKVFEASQPNSETQLHTLWYLKFWDSILHKFIKWNCAILSEEEEVFPDSLEVLHEKIKQTYQMEARGVEILLHLEGDIVFCMLIEKKITQRGIKHGKPFFTAFHIHLEEVYVFYSPLIDEDSADPDHLKLLTQALGFSSYKKTNFTGNDLRNMLQMIKNYIKNKHNPRQVAIFEPRRYYLKGNVLDFTQGGDRLEYANAIFPEDCCNLKEFSVHSRNEFRGKSIEIPPSLIIRSQVTFKSRRDTLGDSFRSMVALGIMPIPVPDYAINLPFLNKSAINIRNSTYQINEDISGENSE